jgi:hypothetical protein
MSLLETGDEEQRRKIQIEKKREEEETGRGEPRRGGAKQKQA